MEKSGEGSSTWFDALASVFESTLKGYRVHDPALVRPQVLRENSCIAVELVMLTTASAPSGAGAPTRHFVCAAFASHPAGDPAG